MNDAAPPLADPAMPLVVGDHVAASLACASCHYDLRTLPADGRCPECNLPVAETIRAVGGWTITRLRSLRWVIIAIACANVFWVVPVLLIFFTQPGPAVRTLFVLCVIGMTMRFSVMNTERALVVAETLSAAVLCTATIAAAGLWRAITARERALRV